jgi:4-amino-4-deoxy-L-arabinose transferase-like glycosyltransferase
LGRPPIFPKALGRAGFRIAAALVAVLALLPLADWIPSQERTPLPSPLFWFYVTWVGGFLVLAVGAWGVTRLVQAWPGGKKGKGVERRRGGSRKRLARTKGGASGALRATEEAWAPAGKWTSPVVRRGLPLVLLLAAPALLYSVAAREVFDGRPLNVDAMTQALQAQIFSQGKLSVPVAKDPRFFSSALLVEHEGRLFSQFAPGWALILAVGFLLGMPWLLPPLLGAGAAYGLYWLLKENGEREGTAMGASLILALSPWVVFNSASWMNHLPTMTLIVLGSLALLRGVRRPGAWVSAGLGGVGLGLATLVRPLEGVAFGLPATVWLLALGWREPAARRKVMAFAAGGCLTVGLLLVYNWVQHGSPATFGFDLQWGPGHGLGFHQPPWGPPHTPLRGVELLNGYLLALQLVFFDAPAPSLIPALAALLLVRRLDALDRYLLAGSAFLLLGYVAFWGEGTDLLGPRYLLPLAPIVALWTARLGGVLADRTGRPGTRVWGTALVVLFLGAGWFLGMPNRWFVYSMSDPLRRVDVGALTLPQVQDALVFVPSPWSAQVQARLRASGLSRQEAQWLYYRVGLCRLDVALSQLDAAGVRDGGEVMSALRPLAADSALMILDPVAGTPGDPYSGVGENHEATLALCQLRQALEEAHGGYLILTFQAQLGPTWTEDGPIVAQDLHEENRRLLAAYPERPAYVLRPSRMRGRIREFRLDPLKGDSVEAVWAAFEGLQEEASALGTASQGLQRGMPGWGRGHPGASGPPAASGGAGASGPLDSPGP